MKKRIESQATASVPGFNLQKSELVDWFSNENGAFVQVWNERRRGNIDSKGRVVLAYQLNGSEPFSITRCLSLSDSEYSWVDVSGVKRTFWYRDEPKFHRFEQDLPSGRVMVDDRRKGAKIDRIWTEKFDWEKIEPSGKRMTDVTVVRLQNSGKEFSVSYYQEVEVEGKLSARVLMQVERYEGRILRETVEVREGRPFKRVTYSD